MKRLLGRDVKRNLSIVSALSTNLCTSLNARSESLLENECTFEGVMELFVEIIVVVVYRG